MYIKIEHYRSRDHQTLIFLQDYHIQDFNIYSSLISIFYYRIAKKFISIMLQKIPEKVYL